MRGEFLPVWSDTWRDIWSKLERHRNAPDDLFSELYRELAQAMIVVPTAEALADIVGVPALARSAFRRTRGSQFRDERALVEFLERAHFVVADLEYPY